MTKRVEYPESSEEEELRSEEEDEDEEGEEEEDEEEDKDEDEEEDDDNDVEEEEEITLVAEIDNDGNGTEESVDNSCVEAKVVGREKKRKRTGDEGGRKNTPSIQRTDEKKGDRKVEEMDNIEVLLRGKVATVRDLFTGERKNIKVNGISYSSGIPIETTRNKKIIEYKKVYRCLMVMN
jgi:hypothetical protein